VSRRLHWPPWLPRTWGWLPWSFLGMGWPPESSRPDLGSSVRLAHTGPGSPWWLQWPPWSGPGHSLAQAQTTPTLTLGVLAPTLALAIIFACAWPSASWLVPWPCSRSRPHPGPPGLPQAILAALAVAKRPWPRLRL